MGMRRADEHITDRLPRARNLHRRRGTSVVRRRVGVGVLAVGLALVGALIVRNETSGTAQEDRGTSQWTREHYGNPDSPSFRTRNIVTMEFLGTTMYVHKRAERHFLRLAAIFEARAPDYAAAVALGTPDDWSYSNRDVRGEGNKSNHAFGIAIDINALANPLDTAGDMPQEVIAQWEIEGGDWGGDWSRPDPMHFESHLTPAEIRKRYRPDGTPKEEDLEELVG